jgi:hypothetical protein
MKPQPYVAKHTASIYASIMRTAPRPRLYAYDGKDGVFAYAVLEGLRGKAHCAATGPVDDIDPGFYVARRVEELAKQKDHNRSSSFKISAPAPATTRNRKKENR